MHLKILFAQSDYIRWFNLDLKSSEIQTVGDNIAFNTNRRWAVVVALLAEQSLRLPEIHGSSLITGKISSLLSGCGVEKRNSKGGLKGGAVAQWSKALLNEREKNENQKILGSPPGLGDIKKGGLEGRV